MTQSEEQNDLCSGLSWILQQQQCLTCWSVLYSQTVFENGTSVFLFLFEVGLHQIKAKNKTGYQYYMFIWSDWLSVELKVSGKGCVGYRDKVLWNACGFWSAFQCLLLWHKGMRGDSMYVHSAQLEKVSGEMRKQTCWWAPSGASHASHQPPFGPWALETKL